MRILALLLSMILSSVAMAAGSIGSVSENKGTACAIERDRAKLPGEKGASIESMDTYTTGACASSITFKDDSKVRITENSKLVIDDFVYDPKSSDAGKMAMKVAMGTVRFASGQIEKNNSQNVVKKLSKEKTKSKNLDSKGNERKVDQISNQKGMQKVEVFRKDDAANNKSSNKKMLMKEERTEHPKHKRSDLLVQKLSDRLSDLES
jgi:hypothetical protein